MRWHTPDLAAVDAHLAHCAARWKVARGRNSDAAQHWMTDIDALLITRWWLQQIGPAS